MTLKDGTVIVDPVALVQKFAGKSVILPHRKPNHNARTSICGQFAKGKFNHGQYVKLWRAANRAKGLTTEGKPRRRQPRNGQSLGANCRLWKREWRNWHKALANLWEQAANGVFGPLEARQNRL